MASSPDLPASSGSSDSPAQSGFNSAGRKRSSALDAFRGESKKRVNIHPLELAALWLISAHLCALPWMLGTMRPWGQFISLGLAVIGFIVALLPRNYTEEHSGGGSFRLLAWPKLIKFPIFWLGLALLSYIVIQALNPAWAYHNNGKTWGVHRIDHISWLPSGVSAPFEKWNAWRMLVIYTSGWLTVCAVWIAFTRRRTVRILLLILGVNGLLVALFGVVERITKATRIYWFVDSPNPYFFASFIYKNHGGSYLDLILAIVCGLASWYHLRGLRRLEKSNPSGVLAFCAVCIAIAVLVSYARGATLVMLALMLGGIGTFIIHQFTVARERRRPAVIIALFLVFGYFSKMGLEALRPGEAWERLRQGITRQDTALTSREQVTHAALEMLGDVWSKGVGSGSFRYAFPKYQFRHPELWEGGTAFWEHAHNDIVQFPIELGASGIALIALSFAYWTYALIKTSFWENPLSVCAIFGAILLLIYAWWDFPFQCPAVLITWSAMWAFAARWAALEDSGARAKVETRK